MTDDLDVRPAVETLCQRIESRHQGLDSVVDLAVLVAAADGQVDEHEMEAIASTIGAVFHSRIRPEVVRVLIRSSVASGQREGASERTRRLADTLRACDAVEPGLAVARAIERASRSDAGQGRAAVLALERALGIASPLADASSPWSLPDPRPRTVGEVTTTWERARAARDASDVATWRAGVMELRAIAAALRDSYLGVSRQHEALGELVDQISRELPERRESQR